MAQWSKTNEAEGSVLWGPTTVKGGANATDRNALYENEDADTFITGMTAGQFAGDGGWELRTTGSGDREGRVQSERLVAMKGIETPPEPPEPPEE